VPLSHLKIYIKS